VSTVQVIEHDKKCCCHTTILETQVSVKSIDTLFKQEARSFKAIFGRSALCNTDTKTMAGKDF
jgi:hypothetical protein